jgi:hypothetical protein
VKLIIIVSEHRPFEEVAEDLAKTGFEVVHVLPALNIITGTANADLSHEALLAVDGVAGIYADLQVRATD